MLSPSTSDSRSLDNSKPVRHARAFWLAVLLLAMSAASQAQFLEFSEYPIPVLNSVPGCIVDGPDDAQWFTEGGEFANSIGRVTTAGVFTQYPVPTLNSGLSCIRVGPDNALWFTENLGNKIGRITTGGAITEYPLPTPGAGPAGIKTGPDGALWFTEENANQIGRITTTGTITEYLIPTPASFPVGIVAGPDGALWFTESAANQIGRITTGGVFSEYTVPTPNSEPWTITTGTDGALWFTESAANQIGRITTAGVVTAEYPVPTPASMPFGITNGTDGALWFTEHSGNNIGRITVAGMISEYAIPVVPGQPHGLAVGSDGAFWITDDVANAIMHATIVVQAPSLTIFTSPQLPSGAVGVSYSQTLSATGGAPPYSWAVTGGSLPPGLVLNSSTGQINGTPTIAGPFSFTVQVTDSSQSTALQTFTLTVASNPISQYPVQSALSFGGITAGPDGALWFTDHTSLDIPNQVGRITTSGAITEYRLAACGCTPGGIVTGSDGALWFAEGTRIGRITTGGSVTAYAIPNAVDLGGITAGPDGALWFTDTQTDLIGRITTAGAISQFQVPSHSESPDGIDSITAGPDGALWFTETVGYIGRITTAGVITEFPVLPAIPTAIAAGPDGALWFTDSNGAIGRITTAGVFTEFPTPTARSVPAGITVGPDSALWFTESAVANIGRITTGGAITEYPIPNAYPNSPRYIVSGSDGALWYTATGAKGGAIERLLPAPTLTAISPAAGAQGAAIPVTLTGTSFVAGGTTVNVPATITLTNLNVVSPTQATVTFNINAAAVAGLIGVSVTTSSGTSQAVNFTILPPAPPPPGLTSIFPSSGVQGSSVPVTLTGTNFIAGPTIIGTNFFDNYSQLVPLTTAPTAVDNGQLTVTATVYPDPTDPNSQWVDFNFQSVNGGPLASDPNALWQVYLANVPLIMPGSYTGLQYYWTANGTAAPNITPISGLNPVVPNLINQSLGLAYGATFQGGNPLNLFNVSAALSGYAAALQQGNMNPATINGFHIAARATGGAFGGATVLVANPGVSVSNVTLVSSTQITAMVNVAANAALGAANVTVSTAGGTSTPPPAVTFTVLPPTPVLTSISPAAGTVGTVISATLNGSNFVVGGTTVAVTGGVTASNVVVTGAGQLTMTLTIPAVAAPGPVNVTVTTAGGTSGPVVFTIDTAPQITTASPLPTGTVGSAYSQGVSVSGGTPPYNWMITAGALPAGLTLDSVSCANDPRNQCLIVGTPTASGTSKFTLQVTDTSRAVASAAFAVTINPAAPVITAITPSSGAQGATVPVTIAGANFVAGASVTISNPGVAVSNVVVAGASQITATFTIAANAALGAGSVVVTTSGGASPPVVFTVLPPAPVLTSISPAVGAPGTSVQVTLKGANFVPGALVTAIGSVTAVAVTVVSPTEITAILNIAANAAAGPVNVSVTTAGGASKPVSFTVVSLLLTSINPAAGPQGASVPVTLTGAGFAAGAQIVIGSSFVTASNVVVVSPAQITATFNISPAAAQGPVSVVVTSGGVSTAQLSFSVGPPSPLTLTSITPPYASLGGSVPVILTGTGFVAGIRVTAGNGLTVSNIVVVSSIEITATFTVAPNAALGPSSVTVTSPGGAITTPVTFTVIALALSSISPATGPQGATVPVVLTGAGFAAGAQVGSANSGVTVSNVVVVSATQITATLNISTNATLGADSITVSVGGYTSGAVTFTVIAPAALTLTSISPSVGAQGASVAVTLAGTGFAQGDGIAIANSGVTAVNIVVAGPTQITAAFTIAAGAVLGAANVTVTFAGGASAPVTFTVLAPPKLTSITPAAGTQGDSVPVTLTGSGFAPGTQVSVNNPGVTVGNIVVTGSTQITATFSIAASAALGTANVTVTAAGATSAAVAFVVNPPPPAITSISATGAPQGSSVAVTLTGTNFVSGAGVTSANSGVTAGNIVVVSATQITATLTISPSAAVGATTVTVTTPGGASAPVTFTVGPPVDFSLSGLPASIPPNQQIPFTVTIPAPYSQELSGVLTLQFTPAQSLPVDPTVALAGTMCAGGTCTVGFQIPATQTSAALSLQTGTVEGNFVFSIGSVTVGQVAVTFANNTTLSLPAPAQAPGITNVSIQPSSSGVDIVVTGYSNTREITEADFAFTPATGSKLQTSTFSLTDVASTFQSYYASDASTAVGSEFVYTQTFSLTAGSISSLQSVTVTLKNSQGASPAVTTNF